jgi:hypothetical protein
MCGSYSGEGSRIGSVRREEADRRPATYQRSAALHTSSAPSAKFAPRWSLHLLLLLTVIAELGACTSSRKIPATIRKSWIAAGNTVSTFNGTNQQTAPQPRYAARTATLNITFGLHVAGVVPLPRDFEPDMGRAPLWLRGGSEIGVIGIRGGKVLMLGISGVHLSGGRLLDIATSADGSTVATAVAAASTYRLDVNLADTSNPDEVHPIARLEGEFDSAQLSWLSNGNLALAAQGNVSPNEDLGSRAQTVPVSGLYLIAAGRRSSMRRLDGVQCPLSALSFSPSGAVAVAQGGSGTRPAILDIHNQSCSSFAPVAPLQVLGWAPNSKAFLYRTADRAGVFRFDLQNGQRSTVAISSGAAAYASDGTVIAFGSQELSWRRAVAEPMAQVKAQLALLDPHQNLTTINSLGFATQSALLAQSTMTMSQVSNDAIIDTAIPGPTELVREIIAYSYPARAAFVVARGRARGPIAVSWSPDGRRVAILDGDEFGHTLSVITPPK